MSRLNPDLYREAELKLFASLGINAEEHFVDVASTSSRVRVLEVGSGSPAIFLHGSPNNCATWGQLVAYLTDVRCLLVDLPGHGLSEPVRWYNHREQSAATVAAVLERFELASVDVIASSLGGLYAYNFAMAQPERVRSLIQMGSPSGPETLPVPMFERFFTLPVLPGLLLRMMKPDPRRSRKMFRDIGHGPSIDADRIPEEVFEAWSALLRYTDTLDAMLKEVRALGNLRGYRADTKVRTEDLASLTMPLLYLWGGNDNYGPPALGDALAALTPGAKIEHFDGFGHLPWIDDPKLIAARTSEFLADLDS